MNYTILGLIIIAFVLDTLWFRSGRLLAVGEEALQFFNPLRSLHLFSTVWYETGIGVLNPLLLPRVSLFFLGALFSFVPPTYSWVFEFLEMFVFLAGGLIGMYMLTNTLLESKKFSIISVLITVFYLFNLYSLSQIFGRFLFTNIALWSFLPVFFYLFLIWEKSTKKIILLWMSLSSFIFSAAYGLPSNIIVLWFPIVVWTIISAFSSRSKKKGKLGNYLPVIIFFFVWVITNVWWLYPYLTLGRSSFQSIENTNSNFDSLVGVSQYFSTWQIMQLRQAFLFTNTYFGWYSNWFMQVCSLVLFVVVIWGVWSYRHKKNWLFLFVLFLIGWFVSKGTNPPFGYEFYKLLFKYIPTLQILRNSYEKFGIIFLLSYAFFFGIGWSSFIQKCKKVIQTFFWIILVVIFGLLQWPFFTGEIFGAGIYNVKIQVPSYYSMINNTLDTSHTRILSLPMLNGDGAQFMWDSVYIGAEPSEFLFDHPIISKITRSYYADRSYNLLYNEITKGNIDTAFLQKYNIQYLLVRNDLAREKVRASSSAEVQSLLQKNPDIRLKKKVGKLALYELSNATDVLFSDIQGNRYAYKKISATHYQVFLPKVLHPITVIFSESYSPLWILKINNKSVARHTPSDIFMNSWYIPSSNISQVDVYLKVWPWE